MKLRSFLDILTNYGFMSRSVFVLGGYMGAIFPLLYATELFFLFFHDVDVMSVTETRYLFYHCFRTDMPAFDLLNRASYDFGTWLCDVDKLIGYTLFSFWTLLYAMVVSKEKAIKWQPRKDELDSLRRLLENPNGSSKTLPFWLNVLIATALTFVLSGAATGLSGETSIIRFATRDPLAWWIFFVLYRLSYPMFMFVWCLHFTIGLQTIIRSARRKVNIINRYFFVMLQFVLAFLFLQGGVILLFFPAGTYGLTLFRNPLISICGFLLVFVVLIVLVTHEIWPMKKIGKEIDKLQPWKEMTAAIKSLPRISIVPVGLILLPVLAMFYSHFFLDSTAFREKKSTLKSYVEYLSSQANPPESTVEELRRTKRKTVWIAVDDYTRSRVSKEVGRPRVKDIVNVFKKEMANKRLK